MFHSLIAEQVMNQETWDLVLKIAPWAIIAVMLFMLFDRRRDKLRGELQGISDALKSVGFHDLPPLIDAIVRGDWEAAKTLWDSLKGKYGSKEGVLQAVANIIEESLEKIMDSYPKLAAQLTPVVTRVALKLGFTAPAPPAPPASPAAPVQIVVSPPAPAPVQSV